MAEDKKKLALAILAKVKSAEKKAEEPAEDDGAATAARELKSALDGGDSAEILAAFKALLDLC